MKFILLCLVILAFPFLGYAKYDLSICAIFQDEAPYLKEWIEYHRMVGVKHFYMYNNDSHDDWQSVLMPYIDEGVVDVYYWPDVWPDKWFALGCQCYAYQDCIDNYIDESKWFAFIDTDEFIVPLKHKKITDELKHFSYGVKANWKCFGTSHVKKISGLMLENLTWRASTDHTKNSYYKSIVRGECILRCENPHELIMWKPYDDKNKRLVIHHYWTRDENYLFNVKIPRYEKWGVDRETVLQLADELNCEQDFEMLRFTDELKVRMFQ